jgi:hypothetical protein
MITKVTRAAASPMKARERLGMNAPRNVRIRRIAMTQGTTKTHRMRETTSAFTESPPSCTMASLGNRESQVLAAG